MRTTGSRGRTIHAVQIGWMAAGGVLCGFLIPAVLGLEKWWVFFGLLAIVVAAGGLVSRNPRRLLLLLLPLILPMNADVHFLEENLRVSLSSLVILGLCMMWVVELSMDRRRVLQWFPRTSVPALAFLVATGASLVIHLRGSYSPLFRLFEPACDFLIFFYLANNIRSEQDVRDMVWMLLLGALLQCVAAILELVLQVDLDLLFTHQSIPIWQQPVGATRYARISGLMEHANVLGLYVSCMIVVLISLGVCTRSRSRKLVYWMGGVLGVVVLINTFSRSAWFLFALFVPGVWLIHLWKIGSIRRAIGPLAVAVLVAVAAVAWSPGKIIDRLTLDESVFSRRSMIEVGINVVKSYPLLGLGFRNYVSHMHQFDETNDGITWIFPGILHNIYVLIAAEQGMVGLGIFLWLNYGIWSTGWRFGRARVSFLNNMGLAFFCFIWMFLLYGMVNPFPRFTYLYFALGMLVAIRGMSKDAGAPGQRVEWR